jgi:hypothetical protein
MEAEVRAQAEPLLGPAGRPTGEAALRAWRRSRVEAHLALPPWVRAARAWCAWGFGRRLLAGLSVAVFWTVLCLPLRAAGLASFGTSTAGVAVLAALAPLAAVVPPWRRGRFEREPDAAGAPWRGSRRGVAVARVGVAFAVAVGALLLGLAAAGPGLDQSGPGRLTAAHHAADRATVLRVLAAACGRPVDVGVRWLGGSRYEAALPGGGRAEVDVAVAAVVGPPPPCG